jgi:hypothetical protein
VKFFSRIWVLRLRFVAQISCTVVDVVDKDWDLDTLHFIKPKNRFALKEKP